MSHTSTIDRLLFVYNADSGTWNALIDSARKLLMVNGCALCSITHSLTGEKNGWKDCRDELGVSIEYIHRNELTTDLRHIVGNELPVVVAVVGDEYHTLLPAEVLERCRGSVADFRGRLHTYAAMKGLTFPSGRKATAA